MRVVGYFLVVWLPLWILCMFSRHVASCVVSGRSYRVSKEHLLPLLAKHTVKIIIDDILNLAGAPIPMDQIDYIRTLDVSVRTNHFTPPRPLINLQANITNTKERIQELMANILNYYFSKTDSHLSPLCPRLGSANAIQSPTELTVAGLPVKPAAKPKYKIGLTAIITAVLPMLLFSVYMYCVNFHHKLWKWIHKRIHPLHRGCNLAWVIFKSIFLRDSPYPPERDDFDDFESESQNDDTQIHCPLRKRIWQLIHDDVQILVPHLRAPQSVLTNRLAHMMEQLHYEHTIQETLTLQVNMDNKLPRGAQGKISPAKKLRVQKSVQGEGVEVIEILTETDDDSAQKTIPLILPPVIMCSAPRMIKASGREALAVCLPGNQTTGNENQNNELQVQVSDLEVDTSDPEIQTSHLGVQANEHKHLNSELEVMSSESAGQIVLEPAEPLLGPSHSEVPMTETSVFLIGQREPLVLLKKLKIHLVGPKIFTNKPESFSGPTVNAVPCPYRSIKEHCTATNLSSVQRKYVGLWRPNERCL